MMSILLATLLATLGVQESAVELKGSAWVNSKEISLERLKGKIVAIYLYEET